jgi:dinuclear metal center YbgI/SA1388 family protein
MAKRDTIISALDRYLKVSDYKDYAPVGLQVEGAATVKKIVTGVSLSMALLRGAKEADAQMVVVHHGMFWKGDSSVLKGHRKKRVAFLLQNDITLLSYHLPLDGHPVVGNNAQIIKMLGAKRKGVFGEHGGVRIGFVAEYDRAVPLKKIMERSQLLTDEEPLYFCGGKDRIKRIAVLSGGAGSDFEEAIEIGADLFITGETWEPGQALAEEMGVGYLALGHYNSEKPGIMALSGWMKRKFKIPVEFVDVPNKA